MFARLGSNTLKLYADNDLLFLKAISGGGNSAADSYILTLPPSLDSKPELSLLDLQKTLVTIQAETLLLMEASGFRS